MFGVGFEVCSWAPDWSVCPLKLHGVLPGLLAQIPVLPPHVSGTVSDLPRAVREWMLLPTPRPFPGQREGPAPAVWSADAGEGMMEKLREEFLFSSHWSSENSFLRRTVFITVA